MRTYKFHVENILIVRVRGKKRLLLCWPWGEVDLKNVKKQGRAEPLIDLGFELSVDATQ